MACEGGTLVNGVCVIVTTNDSTYTNLPVTQYDSGFSMMLALILVASVCAYIFVAGMAGTFIVQYRRRNNVGSRSMDGDARFIQGTLWPLLAPFALGQFTANYMAGGEARKKTKHSRKMDELAAEKARNESALKLLEANGIRARVME